MLNDWLGGQRMRNGHARKNKWEENGTFRLFFCGTRLSEEEMGEIPLKGRERDGSFSITELKKGGMQLGEDEGDGWNGGERQETEVGADGSTWKRW